jgi:hypothetical protein
MGVAPIYRDAYFAIGSVQSELSLRGLLPGEMLEIVLPVGLNNVDDLQIVSPYVLPSQQIEFEAGVFTDLPEINTPSQMVNTQKLFRNGNVYILYEDKTYTTSGQVVK